MLHLWISLLVVFTVQEITSTAAVLLLAKNAGLNLGLIHGLFIVTTVLETAIGFWFGKLLMHKFPNSRISKWSRKLADRWQLKNAKTTEWLLVGLGFLNFTWSTAFIGVWLDIPFWEILLWTTLGDLAWYAMEWGIALGVSLVAPNLITGIVYILVIGVGLTLIFVSFRKKNGMVR